MAKKVKVGKYSFGLSTILKAAVVVLGIVAFCMMFTNQVVFRAEVLGSQVVTEYKFNEVLFNVTEEVLGSTVTQYGATLSFIGYLLILAGAILVGVTLVSQNKFSNYICILAGFVMILGAIFVFVMIPAWSAANDGSSTKGLSLLFGPVFAGILACLGGLASAGAAVLDIKK